MPEFRPRPAEGLSYPNAAELFCARVRKTPEHTAVRHRVRGAWRGISWRQLSERASAIAEGLVSTFGLVPGDRVGLMADSSAEWVILDVALTLAGCVSVPIYPTLTLEDSRFILDDAGVGVLIVDRAARLESVTEDAHAPGALALLGAVVLETSRPLPDVEGVEVRSLADVEARGAAVEPEAAVVPSRREAIGLEDPWSIVYTSGTTGRQKGVVLVHRNIVYEAWALRNSIAVDRTDEHLMILPLAHIFARHMVWAAIECGATTAMGSGPESTSTDLVDVQPTFVAAVPRVYEKIYDRIMDEVARSGTAKQSVFAWAMEVGRRASMHRQRGESIPTGLRLQMRAADKAVFSRIRDLLGGRLRFFVSGAAPLAREIAEFFHAAGILVLEGYGLTESTGATHVNRPDRYRFGTVGPAVPGVETLIAPGGEIWLRGHNVMAGYHGDEAATRAALDDDGWLHTGDVGELVDGFLRITHRRKEIIITAGGKNIAPLKLERRLIRCTGISNAIVHGDRRPYLVALIEIDEPAMMALSAREGLGCRDYDDLVRHPRVLAVVREHVDAVNRTLASFETIKRFSVLPEPLSEARGELTPTGKLRRSRISQIHADRLDGLYEDPA